MSKRNNDRSPRGERPARSNQRPSGPPRGGKKAFGDRPPRRDDGDAPRSRSSEDRPSRGPRDDRGPSDRPRTGAGERRSSARPRSDEGGSSRSYGEGSRGPRSSSRPSEGAGERRSSARPRSDEGGASRSYGEGSRGPRSSSRPSEGTGERRSYSSARPRRDDGDAPRSRSSDSRSEGRPPRSGAGERRSSSSTGRSRQEDCSAGARRGPGRGDDRPPRSAGPRGERPAAGRDERPSGAGRGTGRPATGRPTGPADRAKGRPDKPWKRQSADERTFREGDPLTRRPFRKGERSNRFGLPNPANEGLVRLNRYLAQAGVGSRREADELISTGAVTVNGEVVTELGTKVKPEDIVHFGGQKLSMEQKRYVLLNKPKDTITTTDDPRERHTVMTLIAKACTERLYPVGRLDRNTTGVLLLTNDGDLAKKLTHPSHGAEKIYHVTLDKNISVEDLHRLTDGIHLEDGPAKADEVNYAGETKREVGIKIHMGRNRIVRRMFEALGYEVTKLDRVLFGGLTKKDLQRGHWRHLTEKEVTWLKQAKDAPNVTKEERAGRRTRLSQGSE